MAITVMLCIVHSTSLEEGFTMARITIAALQQENEQLRTLCANWAYQSKIDKQTILRLKAQRPTMSVSAFGERARAWCAANNARSVPADVVKSWRAA